MAKISVCLKRAILHRIVRVRCAMVDVVESVRWSFNHVLRAASVCRRGSQSVCFLSRIPAEAPQDRTSCWRLRVTAGLPVLRTHYTSSRKMLFGMRRDLQSSLDARNSSESSHHFVSCRTELAENLRGMRLLKGSTPPLVATFEFSLPDRTAVGFGVQKEMDSSPEKVRPGRSIH